MTTPRQQLLQERLDQLDSAIADNQYSRVKDADGEVEFRSITQLKQARDLVQQELNASNAASAAGNRRWAIRTTTSKSL